MTVTAEAMLWCGSIFIVIGFLLETTRDTTDSRPNIVLLGGVIIVIVSAVSLASEAITVAT
jgi:hypothetical protein